MTEAYEPDRSLKGKVRRRLVRLAARRPLPRAPERPMISFTFDDAPKSAAETGAALLEARGLRGSYYVSAGLAGQDSPMGVYADREDVWRLLAGGHEIACHTFSHLDLGQASATATVADVDRNLEALAAWGVPAPTSFAYPYGDVSLPAKKALATRFSTLRALHHGVIEEGADLAQTPAVGVEGDEGEALARHWMEIARRRAAWLVLYTHDVADKPSKWGCTPGALERLIDQAVAEGFEVVTVAGGARRLKAEAA